MYTEPPKDFALAKAILRENKASGIVSNGF